jgi:tetratricopeptide (TPR) repeat protein
LFYEKCTDLLTNVYNIKGKGGEPIDSEEIKERLAYTKWDELKIARFNLKRLQKPPFTGQLDIKQQQGRLHQEIYQLQRELQRSGMGETLARYEFAMKNHPHWFLNDHLAEIHFSATGNLELAEKYYQKAVDEYPHYTILFDALGDVKLAMGKYKEAEKLFRASLEAEPTIAQKKANLGVVIGYQERYDEAIALLRDAADDREYVESAHFNLAVYLFKQKPNDPSAQAEAIKHCRIVLENNPNHLDARYGMAAIYEKQGKKVDAIKQLEAALTINPSHLPSQQLLQQLQ